MQATTATHNREHFWKTTGSEGFAARAQIELHAEGKMALATLYLVRDSLGFKRAVASIMEPGTTIVVTADSLKQGSSGAALTVIETEPQGR